MKTPEEIKKGLYRCHTMCKNDCPYYFNGIDTEECTGFLTKDAYAYIQQLEEHIDLMILQMRGDCGTCKYRDEVEVEAVYKMGAIRVPKRCVDCMSSTEGHTLWEYEGLPELARKENKR